MNINENDITFNTNTVKGIQFRPAKSRTLFDSTEQSTLRNPYFCEILEYKCVNEKIDKSIREH